jgi:hypothetical protein
MDVNTILKVDKRDCHRGEYSDCDLLGCDTVHFGRQVPTFLRNLTLPYSEQRGEKMAAARSSETLVCTYETTVRIAISYEKDGRSSIAGRSKRFLFSSVQTGSGVHPASYQIGTGGSFRGNKAAGA